MFQVQDIAVVGPSIAAATMQIALDQNLRAAEYHEAAARCHRAAALRHRMEDNDGALQWAEKAHIKCNDAFGATIMAHKFSAGDHSYW